VRCCQVTYPPCGREGLQKRIYFKRNTLSTSASTGGPFCMDPAQRLLVMLVATPATQGGERGEETVELYLSTWLGSCALQPPISSPRPLCTPLTSACAACARSSRGLRGTRASSSFAWLTAMQDASRVAMVSSPRRHGECLESISPKKMRGNLVEAVAVVGSDKHNAAAGLEGS